MEPRIVQKTSKPSKQPQIEISCGLYSYTLHNIHLEMKCLRILYLRHSGIWELPSSIKYLTGLHDLDLHDCQNLRYLQDDIYKLQLLSELSIPTTKLRQIFDYLDGFSKYRFFMLDFLNFRGNKNIFE